MQLLNTKVGTNHAWFDAGLIIVRLFLAKVKPLPLTVFAGLVIHPTELQSLEQLLMNCCIWSMVMNLRQTTFASDKF